jgi:hypothetical protein
MKEISASPFVLFFLLFSHVVLGCEGLDHHSLKKKKTKAPLEAYQAITTNIREREVYYSTANMLLFQAHHKEHQNSMFGLRKQGHHLKENNQNQN